MTLLRALSFAAVLGLATGAAFAHDKTSDNSRTIGQAMASGQMSQAAAEQYVAMSGSSLDQAQDMTINRIGFVKWGND